MSEAKAEDRARVIALLIEPVRLAGVRRRKGLTVADHDVWLTRLCGLLGYMGAENLQTLADEVIKHAPGGTWPDEKLLMSWAHRMEKPPVTEDRIFGSWLASIEGPKAEAGGYLVELYLFLLKNRRVPGPIDDRDVRSEAVANARRVELTRDRIARDVASDEDRQWLQHYLADQQAARAIVEQGAQRRADKEGRAA
jgi:hypothetical protein